MGARANLIIVTNNNYEIYYDHWGANQIEQYIFWGEKETVKFFRSHEKNDKSNWLDNVWCEGAALIDLDKKVLLFFGGEDIEYEIQLRKVYMDLIKYNYEGYDIKWAHNGIVDLAEYVHENKELVYDNTADINFNINSAEKMFTNVDDCPCNIITIKGKDEKIEIVKNNSYELEWIFLGEKLFEIFNKFKSNKVLDLSKENEFPLSGVHFDIINKSIYLWKAKSDFDLEKLKSVWINWKVYNLLDNYEEHVKLANGYLIMPELDKHKSLERLKDILVKENSNNLKLINEVNNILIESGKKVEVSSDTKLTKNFTLDMDTKKEIFNKIKKEYLKIKI